MNITTLSPYSTQFFSDIKLSTRAMYIYLSSSETQIDQLQKIRQTRLKRYNECLDQYRSYIRKENILLDRNKKHCEDRNKWYREEISKSWRSAISNRSVVLRSVARTNVLKRDVDQWLQRIDSNQMQSHRESGQDQYHEQSLRDSKYLQKYNQILGEYGHRI